MLGTLVRTFSDADEKLVYSRIKEIVEHTALAAGATAEVVLPFEHYYPVTFNDEKLTALMVPSLQKAEGKENVILSAPKTGAEDFSFFQQKVPGLYFFVGGMPKGQDVKTSGPHHTPVFIVDDSAFTTGMKAMCNLVVDYMELDKK